MKTFKKKAAYWILPWVAALLTRMELTAKRSRLLDRLIMQAEGE